MSGDKPPTGAHHLLLIIPSLGAGGAERVMVAIANHWAGDGKKVEIATFDQPGTGSFYETDSQVTLSELDLFGQSEGLGRAIAQNARRVSTLRRHIKQVAPDCVVSFLTECNILTLFATVMLRVPVIVAEHTDPEKCPLAPMWSPLRKISYRRAARVIVLNQQARMFFGRLSNVSIIPNPVLRCADEEQELAKDGAHHTILAMGRFGSEKGFDILLTAFASLDRVSEQRWRLTILGDGPEKPRLKDLAVRLGVAGRVVMPGTVRDTRAYLRKTAVFVLSSRYEGFPMGLCEAMACGLPVVATQYNPSVYDLIESGRNGLVVPVEDSAALADALRRMIADPELRVRLGEEATDISTRFGVQRVMSMWQGVLGDVCEA